MYGSRGKNNEFNTLLDKNNSPIQLISQLKGFFYVNPLLSLSLAITIFSFVGIPPLVGFFAKQMVLSAALDNGYVFISLIAILTSVIGAVYYLNVIKEIFFFSPEYKYPSELNVTLGVNNNFKDKFKELTLSKLKPSSPYYPNSIKIYISSAFSITISVITLVILLFIFMNKE